MFGFFIRHLRFSSTNRPRTLDSLTAPVEDMGVNHGGLHVLVPQEFLHCPEVVAAFHELRGKRMSKGMACGTFQF